MGLIVLVQRPDHCLSLDVKKASYKKRSKDIFSAKKMTILIKNSFRDEGSLRHKAGRPIKYFSNSISHYRAEQINPF